MRTPLRRERVHNTHVNFRSMLDACACLAHLSIVIARRLGHPTGASAGPKVRHRASYVRMRFLILLAYADFILAVTQLAMEALYFSRSPRTRTARSHCAMLFGFPPPLVVEALGPQGGYNDCLMALSAKMHATSFRLNSGSFQLGKEVSGHPQHGLSETHSTSSALNGAGLVFTTSSALSLLLSSCAFFDAAFFFADLTLTLGTLTGAEGFFAFTGAVALAMMVIDERRDC